MPSNIYNIHNYYFLSLFHVNIYTEIVAMHSGIAFVNDTCYAALEFSQIMYKKTA